MKQKLVFALLMGTITTGLVSFTITIVNIGIGSRFFTHWIKAWTIAIIPALISILVISPHIFRLVDLLFKKELLIKKNLAE